MARRMRRCSDWVRVVGLSVGIALASLVPFGGQALQGVGQPLESLDQVRDRLEQKLLAAPGLVEGDVIDGCPPLLPSAGSDMFARRAGESRLSWGPRHG